MGAKEHFFNLNQTSHFSTYIVLCFTVFPAYIVLSMVKTDVWLSWRPTKSHLKPYILVDELLVLIAYLDRFPI